MPRIEDDIKLDFKDVLIRPKRSTLKSRSQVDLERTYIFRNSQLEWTGIPIMAGKDIHHLIFDTLYTKTEQNSPQCLSFLLCESQRIWIL
jgi:hypothetical protein